MTRWLSRRGSGLSVREQCPETEGLQAVIADSLQNDPNELARALMAKAATADDPLPLIEAARALLADDAPPLRIHRRA